MQLIIADKNYSSWSLRPWLAMKQAAIPFDEDMRPFAADNDNSAYFDFSPHGRVPVLIDRGNLLWETLAILEYLAEVFPDKHLWPRDKLARAQARCIAHEMHAGFAALRTACPMNIRKKPVRLSVDSSVRRDIARIETLWGDCLEKSGGPFLFGNFCIADAMYAPVISRFSTYRLSTASSFAQLHASLTSLPAWQDWVQAALQEGRVVPADEI